jgi:hypothetical protein
MSALGRLLADSDIPTIAAHTIGSVGVKQAAMASEERKLRFGNNPMRIARNKYFRKKFKVMVDVHTSCNHPSKSHCRHHDHQKSPSVTAYVCSREFDANYKDANCEDDTCDFNGYSVRGFPPTPWIEYAPDIRTDENAECGT